METLTFTPSQAAKISGVSATLQRDWRRRKILPPLTEAVASYTPFEVAQLMALNALAEQGLSPLSYRSVAGKLGACIVACAALSDDAYSGAESDYLPNSDAELDRIIASQAYFPAGMRLVALEDSISIWRRRRLSQTVAKQAGYDVAGLEAFVQFADGSFEFYSSPISAFEAIEYTDPRMTGALIVVSLRSLGREFLDRAGAFIHVDPDLVARLSENHGNRVTRQRIEAARASAARFDSGADTEGGQASLDSADHEQMGGGDV